MPDRADHARSHLPSHHARFEALTQGFDPPVVYSWGVDHQRLTQ